MTKRHALVVIFASMVAMAFAYASAFLPGGAPPVAAWIVVWATAALIVAVLILGATRGERPPGRALDLVFLFTFVVLGGGFSLALRAPAVAPGARLWFGLPAGAAIILYIVGLLPLLVLPVAYALTFDRTTLSDDELADIRRRLADLPARP